MANKTRSSSTMPEAQEPLDRALLHLIKTLPDRFETVVHDLSAVEEDALQYLVDSGFVEVEVNVSYPTMSLWRLGRQHFACIFSGAGWLDRLTQSVCQRGAAIPSQVLVADERIAHRLTTTGHSARASVATGKTANFLERARRRNAKLQYVELDINARRAIWRQSQLRADAGQNHPTSSNAPNAPRIEAHPPAVTVKNQLNLEPLVQALQDSKSKTDQEASSDTKAKRAADPDVEAHAIAVLYKHPDWTLAKIAEAVGCNEKYLSSKKLSKFRAARQALKENSQRPRRRGWKTVDGSIEAMEDNDADGDDYPDNE